MSQNMTRCWVMSKRGWKHIFKLALLFRLLPQRVLRN